jgi:phytoene dehydrogenase-like protein
MRAFRALPADPKSSYDVVIIGAGIGGLICAGLLTRARLKVLLVEQHYMVGGSGVAAGLLTFDAATISPARQSMTIIARSSAHRAPVAKMDPVDHFIFRFFGGGVFIWPTIEGNFPEEEAAR